MSLMLFENSTFKGENFPDFLDSFKPDSIKGELLNVSGTWEILKIENRWLIFINFEDASYTYNLYLKDSKPALLHFIGDPDNGERVLFLKL